MLYGSYALLLFHYSHWKPEDVKRMSPRERRYWLELAEWRKERQERQRQTPQP